MLRLDHIDAGYGDTQVLRDVSLSVPPSSVVALLGPNGAGKTTLLRIASGLLRPTRGQMAVDGVDLTGASSFRMAQAGISHVPEGRGIFRSLTVRENLVLFSVPGEESTAVDQAVEAFPGLGQRLDQYAGTLSGGEQQMLALTRAYVQRPSFVLLDEVSMGLAPLVVDAIFGFLKKLALQGTALLVVEQYVDRALAIAEYVYLLDRGTIAFSGEPGEIDRDDLIAQYVGG